MGKSKIALVTGGSRGIGRDSALSLARKGIDVILTYHVQREQGEAVVKEMEAMGSKAALLQLDVAKVSSFDAFVEQLTGVLGDKWGAKQIDFLINNAGVSNHTPISDVTEAEFDNLVDIHFKGVFFLTQKLLPFLADHGAIVNTSTGLTRFVSPGSALYASIKGSIEVFTTYLAQELGSRKIRVNVIAPGAINTEFSGDAYAKNPQLKDMIGSMTALGRIGEASDIGKLTASLCSDEMGWVTGQCIEASGGMRL